MGHLLDAAGGIVDLLSGKGPDTSPTTQAERDVIAGRSGRPRTAPPANRQRPTYFADGGIVTDPTLGVVGEAGPEAVIPLSQLSQYMGMGKQEISVKLEVDDDLADFMTARVNRVNGRTSQEDPSAITRIGEF